MSTPDLKEFERLRRRDAGGLRSAFNIMKRWDLDQAAQCRAIEVTPERMDQLRQQTANGGALDEPLPEATLARVSLIIGIWADSYQTLNTPEAAIKFLKSPNTDPLFAGRPPMDIVAAGNCEGMLAMRVWFNAYLEGHLV